MSLKVAIYTAVFGGKDEVKGPLNYQENRNIDYFLITDDNELNPDCYNIIYKKALYDDITKNARHYKILGTEELKNYDFIIWHDANLQIDQDEILEILQFAEEKEIAFFKHAERNCVYDEAIKCIQLEKDYPITILKQILGYFLSGIKSEGGLYDTSVVVKNIELINYGFLNLWWTEISKKSRRDQLSLPYSLKKFKIEPGIIDGNREKNRFTRFYKHKHSKYNYLSSAEPKPFNRYYKIFAIKIILILKRISFNGI